MLSGSEALLWTQGNVPQNNGTNFFKENKGTPRPLLLRRFAGLGQLSESCRLILGLTKMDWNNDALYDRLPVTLSFASMLAQTLKRMPTLTSRPYPFRLFM
jgi:argonaute-like protein implicated in RNA metabolism and viral defense